MRIEDIGGEFDLIDRLAGIAATGHSDLIVGIGDDAAVIRTFPAPAPYLLATTDILVEDRHFNCQWAAARQIGVKAVECNVSDIAAMGGRPTWIFISLVLSENADLQWAENLYSGIAHACGRHHVILAGGDTTKGAINTVNIALLGEVTEDRLCLRSHGVTGDRLMVTGTLGASAAALALLQAGMQPSPYLLEKHLAPTCRLKEAQIIAPLANAMIDISDGLASEVQHICRRSRTGARIDASSIPLHEDVLSAAERLGKDPLDFALSGGEDFELLFSIAPENIRALNAAGVRCHAIGEITKAGRPPELIRSGGGRTPLPGGFNHFR